MCNGCQKLIKAIDEYIEKADADLAGVLEDEGFIKPKKTVKYISELEDGVATVLEMETAFILQNIEADDIKQFSKKWPNIKRNDKIKEALKPVFIEKFQKMVPTLTEHYIKRVDDELRLERLSKPTIAWVEFQLTHPLRGATYSPCIAKLGVWFQLTHPLRGATRLQFLE